MFMEKAAIFSFKIIAYLLGPISFLSCLAGSVILFPTVKSEIDITLIFVSGALLGFCSFALLFWLWTCVVIKQFEATKLNDMIDSFVSKGSPVSKLLKWQIKR